jgi:hypothetical protein
MLRPNGLGVGEGACGEKTIGAELGFLHRSRAGFGAQSGVGDAKRLGLLFELGTAQLRGPRR